MTFLSELRRHGARDCRRLLGAFVALVLALAAHTLLETARDALFLAELPTTWLPLAYVAVAIATAATTRLPGGRSPGRAIALTFLLGAAGTFAFWWLDGHSAVSLVALYVWPGVVTTTLVVQIWLHIHEGLHVEQAKTLYGFLGGGALVGALAGAALATFLASRQGAEVLLLSAAGIHALAALVAVSFGAPGAVDPSPSPEPRRSLVTLRHDRYGLALVGLAAVMALATTIVDFVFKSTLSREVAPTELARVLAQLHMAVNASAIAAQFLLLPLLLRSSQLRWALLLLPAALVVGAGALVVLPGMIAALVFQGGTSVLKHSVFSTASEMLYLPLQGEARASAKRWAASLGQRGGQAFASLTILGALQLDDDLLPLLLAVLGLGAAAIVLVLKLHRGYLDRFRAELRERHMEPERGVLAPLDLRSLESLVAALSAPSDAEVIAALDLLALYGEEDLVPPLILHHASPSVVLRALELLHHRKREQVAPMILALLEHEDGRVRAAALRTACTFDPQLAEAAIEACEADDDVGVRVTRAIAGFTATAFDSGEAERYLDARLLGNREERLSVARGLWLLPEALRLPIGQRLLEQRDEEIRFAIGESLSREPSASDLPVLLALLAHDECRRVARRALLAIDHSRLLTGLVRAFDDPETDAAVRRHIPRTVSQLPARRVSRLLSTWLAREADPRVTLKILRGLGRLRAEDPRCPIDRAAVKRSLAGATDAGRRLVATKGLLRRAQARLDLVDRSATILLDALLTSRHEAVTERVFRLLHILHPRSELGVLHACCHDDDQAVRAAARELLRHILSPWQARRVLALVTGVVDEDEVEHLAPEWRALGSALEADGSAPESLREAYVAALTSLSGEADQVVAAVAKAHAGEVGGEPRSSLRFTMVVDRLELDEAPESVRDSLCLNPG